MSHQKAFFEDFSYLPRVKFISNESHRPAGFKTSWKRPPQAKEAIHIVYELGNFVANLYEGRMAANSKS